MLNLYQLLSISYDANKETILSAMKNAAQTQTASIEQLKLCRDVLLNDNKRADYNDRLKSVHPDFFFTKQEPRQTQSQPIKKQVTNQSRVKVGEPQPTKNRFNKTILKVWHGIAIGTVAFVIGWLSGRAYFQHELSKVFKESGQEFSKEISAQAPNPENKLSKSEDTNQATTSNPKENGLKTSWVYSSEKDEMRGTESERAMIASADKYNLGFPYEDTGAGLKIERGDYADGKSIDSVLIFTTGMIDCSDKQFEYNGCIINVKFDNGPVEELTVEKGNSSHVVSVTTYRDQFVKKLRASQAITIELPFYQNRPHQFTFNTSGFKW